MKIVLACPNWVGDAVMATPAIRSLREQFPQALITLVASTKVQQVLMPNPWTARCIDFGRGGLLAAAKALRREGYDAGVLLPNSFRAALLFRLGRVRRRIGYRRDFRAALLTDGLRPEKRGRQFLPVPQIDYYLSLVGVLGAAGGDRRMELFTDPADEKVADDAFARLGLSGERTLVLAPGASFGPSKLWPPERMAALADAAARRWGLQAAVLCGPEEAPLAEAIVEKAETRVASFRGLGLGAAKAVVRRSRIMVSTDSGLRFFAAAFRVPVVTLFGPTHQEWTRTGYDREIMIQGEFACGPCQKPVCPTGTGECMLMIQPEEVLAAMAKLLPERRAPSA